METRAPDFLFPHKSGPGAIAPISVSSNFIFLIAQIRISWSHPGILFVVAVVLILFLVLVSYLTLENSVGSIFNIYLESSHFSPPLMIITLDLSTVILPWIFGSNWSLCFHLFYFYPLKSILSKAFCVDLLMYELEEVISLFKTLQ